MTRNHRCNCHAAPACACSSLCLFEAHVHSIALVQVENCEQWHWRLIMIGSHMQILPWVQDEHRSLSIMCCARSLQNGVLCIPLSELSNTALNTGRLLPAYVVHGKGLQSQHSGLALVRSQHQNAIVTWSITCAEIANKSWSQWNRFL